MGNKIKKAKLKHNPKGTKTIRKQNQRNTKKGVQYQNNQNI